MRIAQIAPVWFTIPPRGYGGIELVVALLADGLVAEGHEVTLFASGGSRTRGRLVTTNDAPPDPSLLGNTWWDATHVVTSYQEVVAGGYDVVHDHSGIVGAAVGSTVDGPPVVHTLHGPWHDQAKAFYRRIHDRVHLVAISEAQRRGCDDIRYAGMVHNGIDLGSYPLVESKEDYLVYVGRSNPDKGPAEAVEIARRAGMPLKMIVKKSEPFEQEYWQGVVAPRLTPEIEVHEGVSHEEKADLMARARAMVFPIRWPEPFGLVMAEAMACGTPVLTAPFGAAPEVVEDGVTGYLRHTVEEFVEALAHVDEISPRDCRKRVEAEFSAESMVEGYLRVFQGLSLRP